MSGIRGLEDDRLQKCRSKGASAGPANTVALRPGTTFSIQSSCGDTSCINMLQMVELQASRRNSRRLEKASQGRWDKVGASLVRYEASPDINAIVIHIAVAKY